MEDSIFLTQELIQAILYNNYCIPPKPPLSLMHCTVHTAYKTD